MLGHTTHEALAARRNEALSKLENIQAAIESLSEEEYSRLREWFVEKDWVQWDREIEVDSQSGKLDFLVKEALQEKSKGWLTDL
jgi:hypothetical protein